MVVWSGKTASYHHKMFDTPNPPYIKNALRKILFLDVQWTNCPIEVEDQVRDLWRLHELGNDNYILKESIESLIEYETNNVMVEQWDNKEIKYKEVPLKTDAIVQYLREQGVKDDEQVIIHWWW